MPEMDWTKVGAIGTLGCFALALITLVAQRRKQPKGQGSVKITSVLLTIGFVLAIVSVYGAFRDPLDWYYKKAPETISQQHFKNETVQMDGKTFVRCTFTNVTLQYDGLAPTTVLNATFFGSVRLKSNNKAARGYYILFEKLRTTPGFTLEPPESEQPSK